MKIKILEYNVLNGFCGDNHPFFIDGKRLKIAEKIISKENPDILILCEGYFWPFAKTENLESIRKTFKHIYDDYIPAEKNFRWAPILLSKFKIESFDFSLSKPYLNLLRIKLKIQNKGFVLDIFHPHPSTSEKEKTDFLEPLILDKNYILAGDFNSISHMDKYEKNRLVKGYVSFMGKDGEAKVSDMLKCELTKMIEQKGLVDSLTLNGEAGITMPTDLRSKNKDSGVRIDYIFCSKDISVSDSGIIKSRETEKASDHYPIYALVELVC